MKALWIFLLVAMSVPAVAQELVLAEPHPPLPRPRPDAVAQPAAKPLAPAMPTTRSNDKAPAPEQAPSPRIYQAACPAILSGRVIGKIMPPLSEGACGLQAPFKVTGVTLNGRTVTFSQPATLNCAMAGAIADWVERVDAYAQSVFNTGITRLKTGTSYMCRTRNRAAGADISEHGFANALDVTGFELENGTTITLPENWAGDDSSARSMRFAHDAACGHFTTVLGPETNALHADHLHLDLGCHGKTCTYRLCE